MKARLPILFVMITLAVDAMGIGMILIGIYLSANKPEKINQPL